MVWKLLSIDTFSCGFFYNQDFNHSIQLIGKWKGKKNETIEISPASILLRTCELDELKCLFETEQYALTTIFWINCFVFALNGVVMIAQQSICFKWKTRSEWAQRWQKLFVDFSSHIWNLNTQLSWWYLPFQQLKFHQKPIESNRNGIFWPFALFKMYAESILFFCLKLHFIGVKDRHFIVHIGKMVSKRKKKKINIKREGWICV